MIPQFRKHLEGLGALLSCSGCGSEHLHHVRVEVFDREEDAEVGLHVVVEDHRMCVDTELQGNPSRRRHGLRILFACEQCSARTALDIRQHKGSSYLDAVAMPAGQEG